MPPLLINKLSRAAFWQFSHGSLLPLFLRSPYFSGGHLSEINPTSVHSLPAQVLRLASVAFFSFGSSQGFGDFDRRESLCFEEQVSFFLCLRGKELSPFSCGLCGSSLCLDQLIQDDTNQGIRTMQASRRRENAFSTSGASVARAAAFDRSPTNRTSLLD